MNFPFSTLKVFHRHQVNWKKIDEQRTMDPEIGSQSGEAPLAMSENEKTPPRTPSAADILAPADEK